MHTVTLYVQARHWTKYTDIQAESTPLSATALKRHDLQTSYELHQFRCPKCFVWWWRPVPQHKPVCKCYKCWLCLNPLQPLEQFGVGRFVCICGNVFFRWCQASDSRKCDYCGCRVGNPYIRPYFRTDDAKHIPVTPEQQYQFNPYYTTASHGYYHYPSNSFAHPGPTVDATPYDMPQPRRRNTFGDYILPEIFARNSQQYATRNPPQYAPNPTAMHSPCATSGFPPMYPSGSTSLQNSNTSALCVASNHAAALAIQPPAVTGHHPPVSLLGDHQIPHLPVSTPATSEQTTMVVSMRGIPPILDYTPLKDQVIPSSNENPHSVSECNRSPQSLTATSAALTLASGSVSVPDEATAIPSLPISLPSTTENSLQCSPQAPSTAPSTSGPLPIVPMAISSDSDPIRPDHNFNTQPQLSSLSVSEKSPTPSADALADLHTSDTPYTQALSETPIDGKDLLQSAGPPIAAPGGASVSPLLPSTAITQSTPLPESDASTSGVLVKASHVSSEKPPPDHCSVTADYNPSITTAIPPPCDPMTPSKPQIYLTAPNHHDSSQAGSDTDNMSLAAATSSSDRPLLPEASAPTMLKTTTTESSNKVTTSSTAQMDANTQTEVNMSMLASTLPPTQGLPAGTASPSSSSIPQPLLEATIVSTPRATAMKFKSKADQTATLPSVNVTNNFIQYSVHGNPASGSVAKPAQNPQPTQVRNDQWTSYYDNRVRIRKNPRDFKYKQVSTLHDCSGSTEYSTNCSVPQANSPYWKHNRMYPNRNQRNNVHMYNHCDLDHLCMDYDMLEISSDEED